MSGYCVDSISPCPPPLCPARRRPLTSPGLCLSGSGPPGCSQVCRRQHLSLQTLPGIRRAARVLCTLVSSSFRARCGGPLGPQEHRLHRALFLFVINWRPGALSQARTSPSRRVGLGGWGRAGFV